MSLQHPFLSTYAGSAVIVDEMAPQTLYTIDTSLPSGGWNTVTLNNGPLGRQYQRFLSWGSSLYMFSGYQ